MVPKKANTLVKAAAEANKVSNQLAEDIISFYWKAVKTSVISMKSPNIYIEKLGTLKIKTWAIPKAELHYEELIQRYEKIQESKITMQNYEILKELRLRQSKLLNLKQLVLEEEERKKDKKIERNEYKTNMDTPKTDF